MLTMERRDQILALINEKQYVKLTEMCDKLHFSESTLRRDLKRLERERLITCIRGGAVSNVHANIETPLALRMSTNRLRKSLIARRAAELVEDNQMIMMDASTTVMEMVPYLRSKKGLTIITCCLSTAILVAEQLDCTLICTGGKHHAPSSALVGFSAENSLRNWFADLMFFSVNSIDPRNGLTDQGEEIAQLKMVMLEQSKRAVLLADSGKFGQTAAYRLTANNLSVIITEHDPMFDEPIWQGYREKMIFVQGK